MHVIEIFTGFHFPVDIVPVQQTEYKTIDTERYFFNWAEEQTYEVYKLVLLEFSEPLGLISFERISTEWRIHIRLLTVSKENVGKSKKYDEVAGNLIAFVAKLAVLEYGELACVSLKPKTAIAKHYVHKYKMNITGTTVSLEVPEILDLIKNYEK
jgi:hypothetical protein